ncbi:MAG TPA: IS4 family transposase [Fimbriiglobus sp.]|nr:IS4 family transposase [Fimbriiglobus sp.]
MILRSWLSEAVLEDTIGCEAEGVDLGDARLDRRYRLLLERLAGQPGRSIPAACQGRAQTQAAYRFLDHASVTPGKLLAPHREATRRRMAAERTVVVAQDMTEIDLTRPERVVGGPLADDGRTGFFGHVLLAATVGGLPLGLLDARTWSRDPETVGTAKATRKDRPLADKESVRWIEGYRTCVGAARSQPGVEVVCVSESEGDVYELFVEVETQGHAAKSIVRACQDRRLADSAALLFAAAAAAPVLGRRAIDVSNRQAPPSETRKRRKARSARTATVVLRPPNRTDGKLPSVTVTAVLAREVDPPAGEEAIEWLLVTDLPATTLAEAQRVLDLSACRWLVEVYFRTLKTGCRIERLQLATPGRMRNALCLYQVVAWRVLLVTMAGRDCPDLPCDTVFDTAEWQAVSVVVKRTTVPMTPPRLAEMVALVARLGGHQGRKSDPPPGPQAMWVGMQQARTLALAWETFGPGAKTYA